MNVQLVGVSDTISGVINQTVEIGSDGPLTSLVFHIPNFPGFLGDTIQGYVGRLNRWRRARATLEAGGWRVTIDAIPDFDEKGLIATRGYAITHVGKAERIDGVNFTLNQAKELKRALWMFLSFCRGLWVCPILLVGMDANGKRVWEEWESPHISPGQFVQSWFDTLTAQGLMEAFPGFLQRWGDETLWNEPLMIALHWYVESNLRAGGTEGAIILAQAAFEVLAWTLLVEDRRILSKEGFQAHGFPASDKLRLLLSSSGVPLTIPPSLQSLSALALGSKWQDGPQALSEIRNAFVHPHPAKRKKVLDSEPRARHEAWSLAQWYLEMVLLRLFNYKGKYSNRLSLAVSKGDEVEDVPWMRP